MIVFDIDPMSKPRMVKSDAWKKRPAVLRYWAYKDELTLKANKAKFVIPPCGMQLIFTIPMPNSWSKKKKLEMLGKPHQQTPDIDNLIKAFLDCLCKQDNYVWDIRASKFWGKTGRIIITL